MQWAHQFPDKSTCKGDEEGMIKRKFFSCISLFCAMSLVMVGCGAKPSSGTKESSANQSSSASSSPKTSYPKKEITLVVPWEAGGGTDLIARQIASIIEKDLGKPVVVENKSGAGGIVGFQEIAKAKPDGYTIGMITNSLLLQKYVNQTFVDYKSFEPIALINQDPASLTVKADAPWKTAKEFMEEAKSGKVSVANSGSGGIWHVAALALGKNSGVEFKHVPFQGGNPAAVAVMGGHVQATTVSAAEVQSVVQSGGLKILGVASENRLPQFPDVPTLKEQGINTVIGVWRGLVVPKGTPKEIVDILDKAVEKAINTSQYKDFMNKGGFGIMHVPAKDFGAFMDKDDANYAELLKGVGNQKK
jgi:tripartite-type tricarboxylate transporter receptor subunit TctC